MQNAWIFSLGTELALGQTVDTNSAWLARELAGLGIRTHRHLTIADEMQPICDALRTAVGQTDVVLITGGLGPTADDLTRAALAKLVDQPLVLDEDALTQIEAFFTQRGRTMPERNRCQAERPQTGRTLVNTRGTAPGICVTLDGLPIYAMPGVPFEMRGMFTDVIRPELVAATAGEVIRFDRLQTFGVGESDIGVKLHDLMQRGRNPEVGTTAGLGIVGVRINTRAATAAEAETLAEQTKAEVRTLLGEIVFGEGDATLAEAVGPLLDSSGQTVSVAESCTGGLIAKMLTDIAGSSSYFLGGAVTYSDAAKRDLLGVSADLLSEHGAVSRAVAEAMVVGVRQRFGSDYALSVTGIAGPGGGTVEKPVGLVYIGLATPSGVTVTEHHFGGNWPRDAVRQRTAHTALNALRLALQGG